MAYLPLTLRSIPDDFRSVLSEGDETASWSLGVPAGLPAPMDFTPQVDVLWNATVVGRGRSQRAATRRARSTKASSASTATTGAHVSHSADRLAKAIVLATHASSDPRTLTAWGQEVGISRGALRVWCAAAGVSGRSCLDLLRLLRAVLLSRHDEWNLLAILDVVDERSLRRLLERGGVRDIHHRSPMTVNEFMARQRFVRDERVLEAIARELNADTE